MPVTLMGWRVKHNWWIHFLQSYLSKNWQKGFCYTKVGKSGALFKENCTCIFVLWCNFVLFFTLWFNAEETFRFQGVGIFAQCKGNLSVTNLAMNFPFSAVHLLVFKNCNLNIHWLTSRLAKVCYLAKNGVGYTVIMKMTYWSKEDHHNWHCWCRFEFRHAVV